jgi:hypothetical protein
MRQFFNLAAFGFVATIVTATTVQTASATSGDSFVLPGKNDSDRIGCMFFNLSEENTPGSQILRCEVAGGIKPMPRQPESCNLDWGSGLVLNNAAQKAAVTCAGDTIYSPDSPTLEYGKTWRKNGFSCKASRSGLTCTNGKGNGFFLNRKEWKAF